jgi:hypothetical protein
MFADELLQPTGLPYLNWRAKEGDGPAFWVKDKSFERVVFGVGNSTARDCVETFTDERPLVLVIDAQTFRMGYTRFNESTNSRQTFGVMRPVWEQVDMPPATERGGQGGYSLGFQCGVMLPKKLCEQYDLESLHEWSSSQLTVLRDRGMLHLISSMRELTDRNAAIAVEAFDSSADKKRNQKLHVRVEKTGKRPAVFAEYDESLAERDTSPRSTPAASAPPSPDPAAPSPAAGTSAASGSANTPDSFADFD